MGTVSKMFSTFVYLLFTTKPISEYIVVRREILTEQFEIEYKQNYEHVKTMGLLPIPVETS